MFFTLLKQWLLTPVSNYRLLHNFTRQDFYGQFTASIGGWLWLFMTPIVHIIIYAFVFSYIFEVRAPGGVWPDPLRDLHDDRLSALVRVC
jgi:lipopolysaccharide transport system permease protein